MNEYADNRHVGDHKSRTDRQSGTAACSLGWLGDGHASSTSGTVLSARMRFSIRERYVSARTIDSVRVLIVEDEPEMADAIRDGLRLEAIAADIAGDGDTALELLSINSYDIAVLDRDIPGPSGDEIAESIVASGS